MTNAQLLALFKEQIKNYSTSTFSEELIRHWFDEGQIDIVRRTGVNTTDSNLNSVAEQREYDLPTDILRLIHVTYYNTSTYHRLEAATLDEMETFGDYPGETSTLNPTHYYIKQGQTPKIGLYPKPSTSHASGIQTHYVKRPSNLTDSSKSPDIPEAYQRLIVLYALWRCLQKDVKNETSDRYYTEYLREVDRMKYDLQNWDKKRKVQMQPFRREHRQKFFTRFSGR